MEKLMKLWFASHVSATANFKLDGLSSARSVKCAKAMQIKSGAQ